MTLRPLIPSIALAMGLATALPAQALTWDWSFSDGAGEVEASGHFTTTDVADAGGWYEITAITGQRNGSAITGLQAAGTAVPANDDYPVDNLVRASGVQLTGNGFGFHTADGHAGNPFYADWTGGYVEFGYSPDGSVDAPDVSFSAHIAAVPEPASMLLFAAGLTTLALARRRRG